MRQFRGCYRGVLLNSNPRFNSGYTISGKALMWLKNALFLDLSQSDKNAQTSGNVFSKSPHSHQKSA